MMDIKQAQKSWVRKLLLKEGFVLFREHEELDTQLWVSPEDSRYRVFVDYKEGKISFVYPLTDWFVNEKLTAWLESALDNLETLLDDNDEPVEAGRFTFALTKEIEQFYPEETGGVGTDFAYVGIEVTAPLEGWYVELLTETKVEELVFLIAEHYFPTDEIQEWAETIQEIFYKEVAGSDS